MVCWLVLCHRLEPFGKRGPQLSKYLHQIGLRTKMWAFSCSTTDVGEPSSLWAVPSWAGGPRFCKKAGWASHKEKVIEQQPPWPLHQPLPPGSCPAWVPVLTSFNDEQCCGSISLINPFYANLLWSWCFITAIEALTGTSSKHYHKIQLIGVAFATCSHFYCLVSSRG